MNGKTHLTSHLFPNSLMKSPLLGCPGCPHVIQWRNLPPHYSCTHHHSTDGLWASRLHTLRRGRSPSSSSGNWANIIECHAGVYPSSSRKKDNRTCPLCSIIIPTYVHVCIYIISIIYYIILNNWYPSVYPVLFINSYILVLSMRIREKTCSSGSRSEVGEGSPFQCHGPPVIKYS